MLVLSRRENEFVLVTLGPDARPGDVLRVLVTEIQSGGKVRIGFDGASQFVIERDNMKRKAVTV